MYPANQTCCFSGHRPQKLPWRASETDDRCIALKEELEARVGGLYEAGYRHFLCGMAIGCDFFFADAVLALRAQSPDITLDAVIPCRTQPDKWNRKQREHYAELLSQCDTVTVLQEAYTPHCMNRRNEYMVDHASLLLAAFDGTPSGTMNTILYARRQGIQTVIIDID